MLLITTLLVAVDRLTTLRARVATRLVTSRALLSLVVALVVLLVTLLVRLLIHTHDSFPLGHNLGVPAKTVNGPKRATISSTSTLAPFCNSRE